MKIINTLKAAAIFAMAAGAGTAIAHPGHGMTTDLHWHATDTWGFVVVAALTALAVWLSRGDK